MPDAVVVQKPTQWTLSQLRERLVPALERAGVTKAIVFGSYARGTADAYSDLDLAVVLKTDAPRLERPRLLDAIYRAVPIGLDLLVFTPEEFEEGLARRHGVFDRIAEEGVTIHERRDDPA